MLRQVEAGAVGLDAPVSRYLPGLVPGERGDAITVRMLLNHTSGLAEYLPYAYPSLKAFPALDRTGPESLEELRFTRFDPVELIGMGVAAPRSACRAALRGVLQHQLPAAGTAVGEGDGAVYRALPRP